MTLYYTEMTTPLEPLYLIGTTNTITDITFSKKTLESFRPAPVKKETPALKKGVQQLKEYFAGTRKSFALPLEQTGTDFQKTVWDVLERIPYGETRSYKDIAVAAGSPKGYRAAGSANGKNRHVIVVPCHRVIASSGGIGGYAYGTDVKKQLLALENTYK